jgi:5-methylcytosine-specific restriction protein A
MPVIKNIRRRPLQNKPFDIKGTKFNYHSSIWRKVRKIKVSMSPLCQTEGCFLPVHTVDHIVPINKGGAILDLENLQSLCKRHNAIKTRNDRK